MSERDEYLKEIKEWEVKLDKAKKELADLKKKASEIMPTLREEVAVVKSWMEPKELDDHKNIFKILVAMKDVGVTQDKLKEVLENIEELVGQPQGGVQRGNRGEIFRYEDEIESLKNDMSELKTAKQSVSDLLRQII